MREVVNVESGSYPRVPTRGIRTAGPRGTVAMGGVWSPPCHHAWCHTSTLGDWLEPFKRPRRLRSGPGSIS
jgi:hypothetical protein